MRRQDLAQLHFVRSQLAPFAKSALYDGTGQHARRSAVVLLSQASASVTWGFESFPLSLPPPPPASGTSNAPHSSPPPPPHRQRHV